MVTFGLACRKESPHVAVTAEPYPNHWTHHMFAEMHEGIDDELTAWTEESHRFSLAKRRDGRDGGRD